MSLKGIAGGVNRRVALMAAALTLALALALGGVPESTASQALPPPPPNIVQELAHPEATVGEVRAEKARKSKKPRPCRNKNKTFPLCKPRTGTWAGTPTTQGTSGGVPAIKFDVVRKGARGNGSKVENVDFPGDWYCGNEYRFSQDLGEQFGPTLSAVADKTSGVFHDNSLHIFGQQGGPGVSSIETTIDGDFLTRTSAKGTIEGTWDYHDSFNPERDCVLTLRVTWTASALG